MSWPIKPLGELVENCNAKRVPLKQSERDGRTGKYRYYGASGIIDFVDDFLFDGDYLLIGEDGNNLLSRTTPIAFHASGQFWVNNHAHVLKCNGKVDLGFLAYYINSINLEPYITGSAQPKLNKKNLDSIKIPLPPLEKQKRIAAILDKADAIRQKRKQAIELADEFLRSVFLDMFGDPVSNPKGWEVKLISEIAEVQGGLQVSKKRESLPVTCSYLRVANVFRGKLDLSEIKTMQVTQKEMERISLITDDLLVVEGHGNKNEIGRCANWDGSISPIIHQNHLIRVRVINDLVSPHYLADFINSPGGRVQLARASNTTSGLNTISTKMVKDTIVLIPDMKVQNKYIEIRQEIYALIDNLLIGKEDDMHLFNALSQKAFSGQL
ncbi:restriction endonuclease subunit S [Aliivibrio fischeri]|uniref:restriction endonuclease subunit S n=1 Tax=Aliivibrio fischeri TaxID=668 RepID=UPI0012D9DAC7|nr:restriction endonuclease subunit S [Aliivibrio fischeri]MUK61560.1 restriction endonuclease subunit S [Aliivibrio fischeri]MUL22169.1 restriction endonuclease subunit S [Aliivibrio fischeri]MUL25616.1 restriction endonuclease subunit S [Aliivibrio fischeri]